MATETLEQARRREAETVFWKVVDHINAEDSEAFPQMITTLESHFSAYAALCVAEQVRALEAERDKYHDDWFSEAKRATDAESSLSAAQQEREKLTRGQQIIADLLQAERSRLDSATETLRQQAYELSLKREENERLKAELASLRNALPDVDWGTPKGASR